MARRAWRHFEQREKSSSSVFIEPAAGKMTWFHENGLKTMSQTATSKANSIAP